MSTDDKPNLHKLSKNYPAKPIDAKPINGDLSSQETLSWEPDNDTGKKTINFKFWDGDHTSLTNSKDGTANKNALANIYKDLTGKDPKDASDKQINQEILSHFQEEYGEDVKIDVLMVRIDPKDPSNSYLGAMKTLGEFIPGSRERILDDAIAHLGTLDPKDATRADRKLHNALANEPGLNDDQRAKLAELSQGKPGLEGENKSPGQNERNRTTSQFAQPGSSQHSEEPQKAKESRARASLVEARDWEPRSLVRG